eukprot:TRINITY_DN5104_c0_g1_i1.p1 TRINITY_DN5104_c0_g1~~TRINITY_DN5104_c0_g1_i1.p1  ORF type:complete len:665 (-),score=198.54 TRINITY_DN5104_c0_g1_i1:68-2062(-)
MEEAGDGGQVEAVVGETPSEDDRESSLKKVQETMERLLSKDHLQEDGFLQMNMSVTMDIPICILADHREITALGPIADVGSVMEAAIRSENVTVDKENMLVRPVLKPRRNTVILHDLPDGIKEEELRQLFESCPKADDLQHIKPDVNHTAFVSFASDAAAQDAALWLRSQKLRDGSIKCSMKSEQFKRSFFPASGPWVQAWQWQGHGWGGMDGGAGAWPQSEGSTAPGGFSEDGKGKGFEKVGQKGKGFEKDGHKGYEKGSADKGQDKGGEKGFADKGFEKGFDKGKGKAKGKGKLKPPLKGGIDAQMEAMRQQEMMWSGNAAWQQQWGQQEGWAAAASAAGAGSAWQKPEEDAEPMLYKHEFRRYTRQQIIEVCSKLDDVKKPESFKKIEAKYPDLALFCQNPNKDWAPLPSPMTSFASSFLGGPGGGRRRTISEGDDEGERGRAGKERANTWAPSAGRRDSRSMSRDVRGDGDEEESGDWDWEGWQSWSRRRWSWDSSWDDWYAAGSSEAAGSGSGGGPRWVPRGSLAASNAREDGAATTAAPDGEGGEGRESKDSKEEEKWPPKRQSWADAVRSGGSSGGSSGPRWEVKKKPVELEASDPAVSRPAEETVEKDTVVSAVVEEAKAQDASQEGAAVEKSDEASPAPAPKAAQSWADRVRGST